MILIPQYRTARKSAVAAFTGALDSYTSNLWAARWTKRLLTSYTGSLIRIRRSSDNAELDIGYESDGSLDDAAVLAHCGTDTGYVITMYDQSGNSRNLTQSTAASQPRICASGVMLGAVGEHHGVHFSGSSGTKIYWVDSSPTALSAIELFSALKNDEDPSATQEKTGGAFYYHTSVNGQDSHYPYTDSIIYDRMASTVRKTCGNPSNSLTTAHMYNVLSAASDWRLYAGGHTSTTATNTVELDAAPWIGNTNSFNYYQYNGRISGVVLYSVAQSSRATIRGLLLSGSG